MVTEIEIGELPVVETCDGDKVVVMMQVLIDLEIDLPFLVAVDAGESFICWDASTHILVPQGPISPVFTRPATRQ